MRPLRAIVGHERVAADQIIQTFACGCKVLYTFEDGRLEDSCLTQSCQFDCYPNFDFENSQAEEFFARKQVEESRI